MPCGSVPILASFHQWLNDTARVVLPKSPTGQAIQYALNQWRALNRYTQDGRLTIDNPRHFIRLVDYPVGPTWPGMVDRHAPESARIRQRTLKKPKNRRKKRKIHRCIEDLYELKLLSSTN